MMGRWMPVVVEAVDDAVQTLKMAIVSGLILG